MTSHGVSDATTESAPEQKTRPLLAEETHEHPYVSEVHEGKPWFEWCVAVLVALSAALAAFKLITAAAFLLAGVSLACATVRLVLRQKSPWKVRSVLFDVFVGYAFGIGLIATYISIMLISH
ncbi:MAG: DUF3017 domain-containing protein [Bifidobacteriaceae bacterium]|jgi:hypothetical protein|nr:DUF3017 domain-containing protein [Bifidobacteriaceae bacterium]MCI1914663.1 DUF3017 domain-containing protein [Bifidobacteriaceae bacterium]